jgi:DNA polymerase alpha subunit A
MINSGLDSLEKAKEIGQRVKTEVNKGHKLLEIEIDGIFKTLLLLKKKKYAALKVIEANGKVILHKETKGLDLVRRDWCDLSKEMGGYILDEILSGKSRDEVVDNIHSYLRQKGEQIRAPGVIPIENFVVTKGIISLPLYYFILINYA